MYSSFKYITLSLLLLVTLASQAEPINWGHSEVLDSTILAEKRTILVSLPEGYEQSPNQHYQVLYTLDGETHFKHVVGTTTWLNGQSQMLPGTIIVAIKNTSRYRDFTPTKPKGEQSNAGGAKAFLNFIAKELIPHIDKTYRTNDTRILSGHSLGGLFTLYAFAQRSDLFQAYIAHSPWIVFDDMALVSHLEKHMTQLSKTPALLFMSMGYEPELRPAFERLTKAFKQAPVDKLAFHSAIYEQENHMSTATRTLHNALRNFSYFNGWTLPPEVIAQGLSGINQVMAKISKRQGKTVKVPEITLNNLGYQLVYRSSFDQAIEVFKYAIALYPQSTNAYDSLSEAYQLSGDRKNAIAVLAQGIELGKKQNARNLSYMQERMTELKAL